MVDLKRSNNLDTNSIFQLWSFQTYPVSPCPSASGYQTKYLFSVLNT